MMASPTISERLAAIEATQTHQTKILEKLDRKMDAHDERLRGIELKSAAAASVIGGIVSLGMTYVGAKITGKA